MKNILIVILLLSSCYDSTKNGRKIQDNDVAAYLPVVGDSAIYIGATRDREMRIVKHDLPTAKDTIFLDTVYSDTVIIKRNLPSSIVSFIRIHYFLDNFPKDQFVKVSQDYFIMDSFRFSENLTYGSRALSNIFYEDSLKTWQDDVNNISDHKEVHKIFMGRKVAKQNK